MQYKKRNKIHEETTGICLNSSGQDIVDRTLCDLIGKNIVMGGITFLFSVDFRQTLPVIPKGTRADEVRASLKIVVRMEISETITSTNKHEGLMTVK